MYSLTIFVITAVGLFLFVVTNDGFGRALSGAFPWLVVGSFGLLILLAVGGLWRRHRVLVRDHQSIVANSDNHAFSNKADEIGLSVIIPTYNETLRVPGYLISIVTYLRERNERFEVVVADDGSTDNTVEVVNKLAASMPEIRTIANPRNFGKGFAVRTGIANSYGKRVLFADADGSTPIAELERLEAVMAGGASIVIGSRAIDAPGIARSTQPHRKVIGRVFNGIVSTLLLPGIRDTQCGFKLFTRDAASAIFGRQSLDGFGFDVEILHIARRMGYRVDEVAVCWSDVAGSKVNLITDAARMLIDILCIVIRDVATGYESSNNVNSVTRDIEESQLSRLASAQ